MASSIRSDRWRWRAMPGIGLVIVICACSALVAGSRQCVAANAEDQGTREIEEIVVTAQKRVQSIQEVPMSITAIDAATIELTRVQSFSDYAAFVPNLSFGYGGSTLSDGRSGRVMALRGVSGVETVGLYLDDTPVPDNLDPRIIDIERIEILRGPQGTLYGSGSMGGTVRIITRQPQTDKYEVQGRAIWSRTKEGSANYDAEGLLNAPIVSGRAALRIAGFYQADSGVFDRVISSENKVVTNVDSQTIAGGQIALRIMLTENFTVTPQVMYQRQKADGAPWADTRADNFIQARLYDIAEPLDDEWTHYSLRLAFNTGSAEVVSSTSYFNRKFTETEDSSEFIASPQGFGFAFPAPVTESRDYQRLIQEARVVTQSDGPWQFTGGVYYSDLRWQRNYTQVLPGFDVAFSKFIGLPDGTTLFGTDVLFIGDRHMKSRETAVFSEATYSITDRLRVRAGLRWYNAKQWMSRYADGIVNGGAASYVEGQTSADGFNPKGGIEFDVSKDVMVYALASRGYRLGGLNGKVPPRCDADLSSLGITQPDQYRPDHLRNYEIGAHTVWLDRRMIVNGAAYHIVWDDIQQTQLLPTCGFTFTGNAGAATSDGFELEVLARPIPALDLSFGVGYTNARFTKSDPTIAAKIGDRVLQVPHLTLNAAAQYTHTLTRQLDGYLRVDYNSVGKSYTSFVQDASEPGFDPLRVRRSYDIVNATVGVRVGRLDVALFAKNVFDEHANLSDAPSIAADVAGRPRLATNRPRTIGISVSGRF